MLRKISLAVFAGLLALTGCREYKDERPPVEELDKRDKGLQSKDVVQASDQMAMDLLALPEMNASKDRWLIVVDHIENRTVNERFDLDIFIERLRVNLAKHGKGRVQLVENRDKLRELQHQELDAPANAGARTQPDFSLHGRIMEMPNIGTSYFLCQFLLTDLHSGLQIWDNQYEVKVAR